MRFLLSFQNCIKGSNIQKDFQKLIKFQLIVVIGLQNSTELLYLGEKLFLLKLPGFQRRRDLSQPSGWLLSLQHRARRKVHYNNENEYE